MDFNLHELWMEELDILQHIHSVCVEHNLRYSLAYGTLIGAVRHKGFIPWDDDVDIIMPREDYEKLLILWPNLTISTDYILQNKKTNNDFTQNFSKIRKNHTTFIHSEKELKVNYHTGVFVDIFPGDRVAPGMSEKVQYLACAVNLLYARGFTSGSNGVTGIIERILLALPKSFQAWMYRKTDLYIQHWNDDKSLPYFFPNTIRDAKRRHSADMFDEMTDLHFAGKLFCSVKKADEVLKVEFGDYMQLPPEEERVLKHHPLIISLDHNRDEIPSDVIKEALGNR